MNNYDKVPTGHNKYRGFTLVETIVVIVLFTVITLALGEAIASFYRLNAYTIAQSYQVDNARKGVQTLVRDLREMTYADDGTFPLATTSEYAIGFYSDVNRDSSVEYVEYRLATSSTQTTLVKRVFNATGSPIRYNYATGTPDAVFTLSEYVQNRIEGIPIFVYYDKNGNRAVATTTLADIRYVETSVIVNIDPIRDPGEYMLKSSATLRNLKNTL